MGADAIATLTAWGTAAAAAAGFLAAIGTGALAWQTRRLANLTRATMAREQEQLELLRRDRDLRLRPVLEFHGCAVVEGQEETRKAVVEVSNHGQGLAVNAFCVGECRDIRPGHRLTTDQYMSIHTVHIPPGAERREIELEPADDAARHDALLKPTPGGYSVQLGGQRYAVFCLDETGRTLYRCLFGQPGVDRWAAGEPQPPWLVPLLRRVPELKPEVPT